MKIKQFARLRNVEVREESHVIAARNGAGKSSIINAWCWLFTGKYADGSDPGVKIYNDMDMPEVWAAEVSAIISGKEIIRKASPTFETKRATGERVIKTRVNTELFIDSEKVTEREFAEILGITDDFLLLATPSYFFGLDWKERRKIINRAAIRADETLASFDLSAASKKASAMKSEQNQIGREQELVQAVIDSIADVEVPEIPAELMDANSEYKLLTSSDNSEEIARINQRNNEKLREKSKLLEWINAKMVDLQSKLNAAKAVEFTPEKEKALYEVGAEPDSELIQIIPVESFKLHAVSTEFAEFPAVAENVKRIRELKTFDYSGIKHAACPISGEECKTAAMSSESAAKKANDLEIERLIAQNRQILQRAYDDYFYAASKKNADTQLNHSNWSRMKKANQEIMEENAEISERNKAGRAEFNAKKEHAIATLSEQLEVVQKEMQEESEREVEYESLPVFAIDYELIEKVKLYEIAKRSADDAMAVNRENAKKMAEKVAEMEELRKRYSAAYVKIAEVQGQIDSYIEKMSKALDFCFPGQHELKFEFYQKTLSGEYNETFRMFIDGKEFPNTALKLHAGMQLISGLSNAFGIPRIVFIDNAECTSGIDSHGLTTIELRYEEVSELMP